MSETINWDRAMLARFIVAYLDAVSKDQEVFTFDGHDFLVSYAKYLLEYLQSQLGQD
jgi:hypothetical protein